jgi:transposase
MFGIPAIALATFVLVGLSSEPPPSCATDLALLERKLHLDYAGYTLELRGDRLRAFAAMKAAAQLRADSTTGDACYVVLRDFAEWFDDPHLFIFENSAVDTAETARRAATVERRNVSEEAARAYFRAHARTLDPIEGIWYDRGLRVAIVPDSARGRSAFAAILQASDTSIWPVGAVRARITRRAPNSYDVLLCERNYALMHRRAEIFRHVLLRLSPGIWGKEFPIPAADSGTLDPVDAHRPVLYRRNGTLVFAIPSNRYRRNRRGTSSYALE